MTAKRLFPIIVSIFALTIAPLSAQDLAAVGGDASRRLDEALAQLGSQREQIREEKLPIATRLNALQTEVQNVRREADRIQRLADNSKLDLTTLTSDNKARQDELDYILNLMGEYARSLEARTGSGEYSLYEATINDALNSRDDPEAIQRDIIANHLLVVNTGIKRANELIGGKIIDGSAIVPGGRFEPGKFALMGPVSYFASSQSDAAGITTQGRSLQAVVNVVANGQYNSEISNLTKGQLASVPYDPTMGNALAIAAIKETFTEHIVKGGIWIYPILFFALLSFTVAAFKAFEIYSMPKLKPGATVELLKLLSEGKKAEAIRYSKELNGPTAKMLQEAVRFSDENPELIEEIQYECIMESQPRIMRLLPFISVTAAVSPLLGLLGTVTGMINTFKMIEVFGTGDAKQLSGGISEALITTEFGLIVAIPSLLLYALLSRKAKSIVSGMEKSAIGFLNGIKTIKKNAPVPQPEVA